MRDRHCSSCFTDLPFHAILRGVHRRTRCAFLLTLLGVLALATLAEARPVTAIWDRNTDEFTVGYRLFYGTSSGVYPVSIDVGNVTTQPLNLIPGSTYFFVVRAYDSRGFLGEPSNEATITLPNQAPSLPNPGDLVAPAGPVSAPFTGTDPDGDALSYSMTGLSGLTIDATTGVISGFLYPPGTHTLTITATDGHLQSQRTFRLTVVGAACPGPPAAATLLAPVVSGNGVTLSWTPPTGGIAPLSYVIQAGSTPGQSNIASIDLGVATTISATVGNGQYFVRIASRNACGDTASNERSFTVGPPPPNAPTGLTFTRSGSQVTLMWNAASGGPTSYVLEAGSAAGLSNLVSFNTGSTATTFSANAPPGRYFVRIRAANLNGLSGASNEVIIDVP
jgi:hypothetical protein